MSSECQASRSIFPWEFLAFKWDIFILVWPLRPTGGPIRGTILRILLKFHVYSILYLNTYRENFGRFLPFVSILPIRRQVAENITKNSSNLIHNLIFKSLFKYKIVILVNLKFKNLIVKLPLFLWGLRFETLQATWFLVQLGLPMLIHLVSYSERLSS